MSETASPQPDPSATQGADYSTVTRDWLAQIPIHRRISARIGLQGKLMVAFAVMLLATLGGSYWLFISEGRAVVTRLLGEQAAQTSRALAMSVEPAFDANDQSELRRIALDMIERNGSVAIAFFNASGQPIVFSCRDPRVRADDPGLLPPVQENAYQLLQVVHRTHPRLGSYAQVTSPIIRSQAFEGASRGIIGYVLVGIPEEVNWARLQNVSLMLSVLGAGVFMTSLPLVFLVVHRIFLPIRQLVVATHEIATGNLDTRVEIHRPDDIGDLARSFNDMTLRVKRQRTDLATANAKLTEANRDLEGRIHQRTSQLEAANRRLSTEIAEKEDFLRAVSHDLNAPLRNISGMATMLLMKYRDKIDEDITHRLERIQKNVEVETDLITELLELSRIKTRRQKMESVNLQTLVSELGDVFENDLKSRQISLVIDTPLPIVNCEKARMRQVFQNLVDNAIKYMGDGTSASPDAAPVKEIHFGCSIGADETEFYVSDTGIGIDPEDLDKVFYVFRRGKNSAAQHVAGKGVGLASVKSIVETYNGSIWVQSERGHGSTFRFTLNGKFVPCSGSAGINGTIDTLGSVTPSIPICESQAAVA